MNVYDSDKMKDIFISHNMQPTDDYLNADFVVLNTCHIREKATEKTFSHLGRINKKGKKDKTTRKTREELSISATKSIKKENVEIIVTFD